MNKQARLGMGCGVSIVALLTAGCAAVVDGVHQPVSVTMRSSDGQDIAGATCKLENAKGIWYATTPGSVVVHRSMSRLQVSCTKPDATAASASTKSHLDGWIFGNIAIGGLIGLAVDLGTGAGFKYPRSITITDRNDGTAQPVDSSPDTAIPPATQLGVTGRITDRNDGTAQLVDSARNIAATGPITSRNDGAAQPFDYARNAAILPAVRRGVTGDAPTLVAAHADLDDMCKTSGGTPAVEVIETSQHGSVDVRAGQFIGPDPQAARACPDGKIYGTQIYYQANANFHGRDRVRYVVATATGRFEREVDIDVN
ncbi:hypothetical protein [Burkholderia sp. 22PA0106]|uniref:hypothetical protein n=1 Tax=Burkholderia sp. 22PA0106 TaxID=3237371 RepID=UPI0039C1A76D